MYIDETSISCGVYQVYELYQEPVEICFQLGDIWFEKGWHRAAFIIWSDTVLSDNGRKLREYITSNGLGEVQKTVTAVNPNSGNVIQIFTCKINHKGWEDWYTKQCGE